MKLVSDPDAERAVLGSVLERPDLYVDVAAILQRDDLHDPAHREMWDAMVAVDERGEVPDVVAVAAELRRRGSKLSPLDVREVAESAPIPASATRYAEMVARTGAQRRLVRRLGSALAEAQADASDPGAIASALSVDLLDAVAGKVDESRPVGRLVEEALEVLESRSVTGDTGLVPTGFRGLDSLLGGMGRGQLILVASRPGVGKSALVSNVARNVAGTGLGVAMFSLEMSRFEVVMRLLCSEAQVPFDAIRSGRATAAEWRLLTAATETVVELPLVVVDRGTIRVPEVRSTARRVPALGLVVVDYVQLMRPARDRTNRQEEVADISRGLKLLAKELDVPLLACAQLNRDLERRSDRRPQLSDLRESGQLEQDSDVVVLLHRDAKEPKRAEAIVAKHRNGPTDTVRLDFYRELTRFTDPLYD